MGSALHELVCGLTKKVLSVRRQVGYNKKHNFELWYNVRIYLADRQKSRRGPEPVYRYWLFTGAGPEPVRGPVVEKRCFRLLPHRQSCRKYAVLMNPRELDNKSYHWRCPLLLQQYCRSFLPFFTPSMR